jgi:uncharacterized cupredoxin-like copper-binding protein
MRDNGQRRCNALADSAGCDGSHASSTEVLVIARFIEKSSRERVSRRTVLRAAGAGALLSVTGLLAACGGGGGKATPRAANGSPIVGTLVKVSLKEYSVSSTPVTVQAGQVSFDVTNNGTMQHEFVILKTTSPAARLKMTSDGSKADEQASGTVVGKIDAFAAGKDELKTVRLDSGHYALICNLPGHYKSGMFTDFQVSEGTATP